MTTNDLAAFNEAVVKYLHHANFAAIIAAYAEVRKAAAVELLADAVRALIEAKKDK